MYGKSAAECLKDEALRQAQKTLGKAVGEFHQIILGSCKDWVNLGTGDESHLDLRKDDNSVFAEIKNKFNTTNADSGSAVFKKMQDWAMRYPQANIYQVQIIRKTQEPYKKKWTISGNANRKIQVISGDRFYAEVTGEQGALADLYEILPQALEDFVERKGQIIIKESTVIADIEKEINERPLELSGLLDYLFEYAYNRKRN